MRFSLSFCRAALQAPSGAVRHASGGDLLFYDSRKKLACVESKWVTYAAMREVPRAVRAGSIAWSLALGGLVIFLGGSLILPSTKRSHFDFRHQPGQGLDPAMLPADPAATQPHSIANEPPKEPPNGPPQ
jgi:hypothetical protein